MDARVMPGHDTEYVAALLRKFHPCAGSVLPPAVTGFEAISVNAITQGALPLFTQLCRVPRCTSTSPALRCTLPISSYMSISPAITTA